MKITIPAAAGLLAIGMALPALAERTSGSSTADDPRNDTIDEIVVLEQQLSYDVAAVVVEREPAIDTAEVLRRLPGADSNYNGRLTGIAQYRGMFGDRVSVNIDGLGVIGGGPNAMDAPLSYVSPMITEALVLERGIPGVASAPEAIGGHVEAQLARGGFGTGREFTLQGMAGFRYADNGDTSSAAGRITAANQSHRLSLVGQFDRADDQQTPAGTIVPSELSRDRYDASYAYSGDSTDLMVFAGGLETRDTGTPALAMDIRYIDTTLTGVSIRQALSEDFVLRARFGYNDVDHLMDNFSLRTAPDNPMQFRQNLTAGSGSVFNVSGELQRDEWTLTAGVDGRLADHDSRISNPNNPDFFIRNFNDIERDVLAAYVSIDRDQGAFRWELGTRFTHVSTDAGEVGSGGMMGMMAMNAGALADAFNQADRSLSFDDVDLVLKSAYELSDVLTLSVDLGSRSRAPSYQELYLWLPLQATGGLADGRNYVGNLALESERSNEITIGVDWSTQRFSVSPQVYYKDVSDYIQGVPANNMVANMVATMMSGNGALMFDNVDAEIYGFDLGWNYRLTPRLQLDGTASFTRGKRTDLADNLYRLAPLNGSLAISFVESTWSVRAEWIGYDNQDKVSAYNEELQTPGYGIVNALAAWNPVPALRLELSASNLFDRGYQDHLAGVNRVRDVDIPVGERLYGAERTVTVGAVLSF